MTDVAQGTAPKKQNAKSSLARFAVVTAVATPTSFASYLGLMRWSDMRPMTCNLIAALVVSGTTYTVNRRWVWVGRPVDSIRRAAALYWLSSIVNIAAASLVLELLKSQGSTPAVTAVAPITVYTSLWFVRFAFLDCVVFRGRAVTAHEL